jgi:hypothetical protein
VEKILLGLTIFFFTVTGLFYYFLSSFNEENRRQILMNRIVGVSAERTKATPTVEIAFFPTKSAGPSPTVTPTPPEIRFMIPLGEIMVDGRAAQISAAKKMSSEAMPTTLMQKTENVTVPFADFEIELKFPENIMPGSAENKFIFQNKEYQIKVFSQVGTENGYLREKFYAEKTGKELFMMMYKIAGQGVIINRETGWWGGGEQVAVAISPDGTSENVIRFFIE